MSASKPMILPLVVVYSIGGNVGSVQYVNVARRVTVRPGRACRGEGHKQGQHGEQRECVAHVLLL